MSIFKNVALMGDHWAAIITKLESDGTEADKRHAAMIREQLDGSIRVIANSKQTTFKAPKGGDLRDALVTRSV